METWQKNLICRNIEALRETTECNDELIKGLLEGGALSSEDVFSLRTVQNRKGGQAQSSLLYFILLSRTKAYEKLAKSLFLCRQFIPFKLLWKGFRQHGLLNPFDICSIPINFEVILSADVHFQGKLCKLQDLFSEMTVQDVKEIFKEGLCHKDCIELFFSGEKNFMLVEDTLPPLPLFYIPRSVSNRVILSRNIFKQKCKDVFVIKGISRAELTSLVQPNMVSSSKHQLIHLTSRFISLDSETDWPIIKNIASCPAHLIEAGKLKGKLQLKLVDSTGISGVLWQYIQNKSFYEDNYISEDKFLDDIDLNNSPTTFCICDNPGTGKSWLLANVARNVSSRYPNRITAFLKLSQFVKNLEERVKNSNMTHEIAVGLVLEQISSSDMALTILRFVLAKQYTKMDIFFDGLDEVRTSDLEWTKALLKAIAKNEGNIRVFVTSRAHLQRDLETTLDVVSYDILSFNEASRIQLVVEAWKQNVPNASWMEVQLNKFAELRLQNLQETWNKDELNIIGVPLQCKFLARIYTKAFNSDADMDTILPTFDTIYEFYKKFLETCFSSYKGNQKNCVNFHVWKALDLFFPEIAAEFADLHEIHEETSISSAYLSIGILKESYTRGSKSYHFIHSTIAEFLAAEYFAEIVLGHHQGSHEVAYKILLKFFTNEMVTRSSHQNGRCNIEYRWDIAGNSRGKYYLKMAEYSIPLLTYFFNARLNSRHSSFVDQFLVDKIFDSIEISKVYKILQCSLLENHASIFQLFIDMITTAKKATINKLISYLTINASIRLSHDAYGETYFEKPAYLLLYLAAKYSKVIMMEHCFQLFHNSLNCNMGYLFEPCSDILETPVDLAARRGNVEILECIQSKIAWEPFNLLCSCIRDTEYAENMEARIETCKLLLKKSVSLSNNIDGWNENLLEVLFEKNNVDLELVKCLIKERLDIFLTFQNNYYVNFSHQPNQKIICLAANYMSPGDFHELCCFLIRDCNATALFRPIYQRQRTRQCVLQHILARVKNVADYTIEMLLDVVGIDVNEKLNDETFGDNLVLLAVRVNRSLNFIKQLAKRGADFKSKDNAGSSVLHIASENGNMDLVKYFLAIGLPEDACDNIGNTIAHTGAWKMSKENFHEFFVLLSKWKDTSSLFIIKNKRGQYPLHVRLSRKIYWKLGSKIYMKQSSKNISSSKNENIGKETLSMLLELPGLDINATDHHGYNLFLAAVSGRQNIQTMNVLISHGADFKACNDEGQNALHLAVRQEQFCDKQTPEIVRYLISLGLDANQLDRKRLTPVDEAMHTFGNCSRGDTENLKSINEIACILREAMGR